MTYELTKGELFAIRDALSAANEELEHVEYETDHVISTGAIELCRDAILIVESLLS